MDELAYRDLTDGDIENQSDAELIDIIENIWGFEETSAALRHLIDRDPQKSLELGKDILQNNKGDDYLQATVWVMISDISPTEAIESLSKREEALDSVLLHDILHDISCGFYARNSKKITGEFINKIVHSYDILDKDAIGDEDTRKELIEYFDEFVQKIKD